MCTRIHFLQKSNERAIYSSAELIEWLKIAKRKEGGTNVNEKQFSKQIVLNVRSKAMPKIYKFLQNLPPFSDKYIIEFVYYLSI